jgi:hypothetical protein
MFRPQSLPTLTVDITSPVDGGRARGPSLTVSGTANAQREVIDNNQQAVPKPDPVDPGNLADEIPGSNLLPSGPSDDVEDVTRLIEKVEISVAIDGVSGAFQQASPSVPGGNLGTWRLVTSLPAHFNQAVITARAVLGDSTATKSIRVNGVRQPVLVGK